MTIHDMLKSAATDLTAMEIKMRTLESQIETTETDNARLRKALAASDTARVHAQADLIHYQNIFKASACVEAMKMCQKFFEITHAGMREEAEEAIHRMVQEKVDKEREESAAKPALDIDELNDENARFQELAPTAEQVQAAIASQPENDTVIQAPEGMSTKEMKQFYKAYLNYLPPNYAQRPIFYMVEDKWHEKGSFAGTAVPKFLSNREPREELRGGISKLVLATFGG